MMRQLVHSVHRRRRSSTIVRDWLSSASFRNIIGFWAKTNTFWFWLEIVTLRGTVERLTKAPAKTNRLTMLVVQTMV